MTSVSPLAVPLCLRRKQERKDLVTLVRNTYSIMLISLTFPYIYCTRTLLILLLVTIFYYSVRYVEDVLYSTLIDHNGGCEKKRKGI